MRTAAFEPAVAHRSCHVSAHRPVSDRLCDTFQACHVASHRRPGPDPAQPRSTQKHQRCCSQAAGCCTTVAMHSQQRSVGQAIATFSSPHPCLSQAHRLLHHTCPVHECQDPIKLPSASHCAGAMLTPLKCCTHLCCRHHNAYMCNLHRVTLCRVCCWPNICSSTKTHNQNRHHSRQTARC